MPVLIIIQGAEYIREAREVLLYILKKSRSESKVVRAELFVRDAGWKNCFVKFFYLIAVLTDKFVTDKCDKRMQQIELAEIDIYWFLCVAHLTICQLIEILVEAKAGLFKITFYPE